MFADGIRLKGLALLAKYHIKEGLPLCLDIIDIERWNKRDRITRCLKALQAYGGAAAPLLPRLAELEKELQSHREANALEPQLELVRQTVAVIKADKNPPMLRGITAL